MTRGPGRAGQAALVALLAGLLLLVGASPAAADAPGPTDYRSEIVSLEPPAELELRFIGGDSFIELAAPGQDVVVLGYRGEPYLWFQEDGTVLENRRSPSVALNEDRFGAVDLPDAADADAPPEWAQVATDGVHAWHDHRTHWMNPSPPPGADPGDQILEGVVPLVVDGTEVDVTVASYLLEPPSAIGWVVPLVLGAGITLLAWRLGRPWMVTALAAVGAGAATVAGVVAHRSVPPETGPSPALWLLPVLALAAVVGVVAGRRFGGGIWVPALLGVAGAELAMWGWTRREALTRALVPTDLAEPVDRALIAGAAGIGVVITAFAVVALLGGPGRTVQRAPAGRSESGRS